MLLGPRACCAAVGFGLALLSGLPAAHAEVTREPQPRASSASAELDVQRLLMMGQYDRALRLAERALAETSTRAGPDSPAVASSLRLLAVIQLSRGDYHAAEPPLERARVILERAVVAHDDDYNSELCAVLNDLAELYHQTGEFRRAEPLFARARRVCVPGIVHRARCTPQPSTPTSTTSPSTGCGIGIR